MDSEKTLAHKGAEKNTPRDGPSTGRRRIITGLAASPILFALSSRAVLGAQACAPSGFMSGSLSATDTLSTCGGKHPAYWLANPDDWPHPYKALGGDCSTYRGPGSPSCEKISHTLKGSMFKDCFPLCDHADESLYDVLQDYPDTLACHAVAGMLNAAYDAPEYLLEEGEVQEMYTEWYSLGYYEINPGQLMYEYDLITFFENTYA